jgi:phosphoribosylformimino-5-aminoimidazole carboxamide ribonucleotide (ProFAR) isomerase
VALSERFGAIPGVGALVVTGIDVDGTLSGPDVEPLSAVLAAVGYYFLRAEKEGVAIDDVVTVFD